MLQTCSPKRSPKLFSKAAPESCSSKLLPKAAPQSCVLKYTPQGCPPQLRFFKAAVQSYSSKLLPKLFPGAAPQSCAPKLSSKADAPKLRFCKPVRPKAILQSGFRKLQLWELLSKAAVQSYCPKAAILQTYAPKWLPKAILQSGSRKLLPKVATKLLPEVVCVQPDRNIGIGSNKLRTCRYTLRLALLGAQQ